MRSTSLFVVMAGMFLTLRSAQAQRPQSSPAATLLIRARLALNDLKYAQADSMSRAVLQLGPQLDRAERIQALRILIAALYPDDRAAQHRDAAIQNMMLLVQLEPAAVIPGEISWGGLDSLMNQVRTATFAVLASPPRVSLLKGPGGVDSIPVSTTRASFLTLTARPLGGTRSVALDSAGPTRQATLRLRVLQGDQVRLPSGNYELTIVARDAATRDSQTTRFSMTIEAPPLQFVPVPAALDSSKLLPERGARAGLKSVVIGLGVGGMTVALGTLASTTDKSAGNPDRRAYAVALGISLAGILAAGIDKGAALPGNAAKNADLRARFGRSVAEANAENLRRRESYEARVSIEGEGT
jgi:hypothetical protein